MAKATVFTLAIVMIEVAAFPVLHCPDKCTCILTKNISINIDCTERRDVDDVLHQTAIEHPHLQHLEVSGSFLPSIPLSVSSFARLETLTVINSSLEVLSPKCFNQMKELKSITIQHNPLTTITDSAFENDNLQYLVLESNNIDAIGHNVFSNKAHLPNLRRIDLGNNNLKTLDPWPFIRMLNHEIDIDLSRNQIMNLTNHLGWQYNCDKGALKGILNLKQNSLRRFSDFEKWLTRFQDALCIHTKNRDTRIQIEDNKHHCDCKEYAWIKIFQTFFKTSTTVARIMCHSPSSIQSNIFGSARVTSVPLDSLVCVKNCLNASATCTEQPHRRIFYIESNKLLALPHSLPTDMDFERTYSYHLLFNNSQITSLQKRLYLANTSHLDLSHSNLQDIETSALEMLSMVGAEVKLNHNHLKVLPKNVKNIDISSKSIFYLHENPWICSCENEWMKEWMIELAANGSLYTPYAVLCESPKWLRNQKLLEADFCSTDPETIRNITISTSMLVGFIIILVIILVLHKAGFWNFVTIQLRCFNEWDNDRSCRHDAFVSFAWSDYDQAQEIVETLEEEHGFRCCIHNRDFNPANRFIDQMGESIDKSHRTICLISPSFIESEYCLWEFSYAFTEEVRCRKKRLVVVMLDSDLHFNSDNQVVRQYINTYTYLDRNDPAFFEKLLKVMPDKPETLKSKKKN